VLTATGFSGTDLAGWTALYRYLEVAVERDVGVWITDRPGPSPSARVFGFASYLLVAGGPYSAYSPTTLDDPLYRVALGKPTADPQEVNGAYMRTYEQGAVAVNPGSSAVKVDLGTFGTIALEPGRAVVATADHTYR
jgi:hypothetical protein